MKFNINYFELNKIVSFLFVFEKTKIYNEKFERK